MQISTRISLFCAFAILFFFSMGCTENVVQSPPFSEKQFYDKATDLNVLQVREHFFDGNCLGFVGGTLSDINCSTSGGGSGDSFWDRNATSATITPATANDVLDMTSGTTTITASNITGTATATIQYDDDYCMEAYGYASQFKVFGYKDVGDTRIYSSNWLLSNAVTDNSSEDYYRINISWTDNSANFDGYRILLYSEYDSLTYDYYLDSDTNSLIFDDSCSDYQIGSTVTPNSVIDYVTHYPIVTNGLDVENITNDGNAPIFPDGLTSEGTSTFSGTNNFTGSTLFTGNTRFNGPVVADTLLGMNRFDIGNSVTYGNPRLEIEDYRGAGGGSDNTLWQIDNWYGALRFLNPSYNKLQMLQDPTSLGYFAGLYVYSSDVGTAKTRLLGNGLSTIGDYLELGRTQAWNTVGNWEPLNIYGNAWWEGDNNKAIFGAGKDATILYDGTNMVINPKAVGTGVLKIAGNITPSVDDGGALGTTALKWSDLFLAGGSVISWNNLDINLVHSADLLRLNGGILQLSENLVVDKNLTIDSNTIIKNDNNIILTSPNGTKWNCGVSNTGVFSCS